MSGSDPWPPDYFASREAFLASAGTCGARVLTHPLEASGPHGEPLSVDTAVFGPGNARHLIVLSSGVHGVEGFLGARIQTRVLRRIARQGLPDDVRVALVHAVNPWGFAHLRRVDERNVDVNRNFLGATRPRSAPDSEYAALDSLINPRAAPSLVGELAFWSRAAGLIVRERGAAPLAGAIAEGQDRFPKGLFHAGAEVGESARTLQALLLALAGPASRVTHLDVHSGLGPSAVATLIASAGPGAADGFAGRLHSHYGQPVTPDDAPGNPYDARGTLARWYRSAMRDRRFVYLCVEIGTANPLKVLSALKRENQAHHWAPRDSAAYGGTKRALLEVFAPSSRRWREESVRQGLHTFERTLLLSAQPRADDL